MRIQQPICYRAILVMALIVTLALASTRLRADTGTCGGASITLPFTDVPASNIFFCAIAAAYFSGLTNGTSATTYSPQAVVSREQMAAFVSRTLDQSLRRGSKRAVAQQWWRPTLFALRGTDLGASANPFSIAWDGADLWVANFGEPPNAAGTVSRVRASDGRLLGTWTGAQFATDVIVAAGRVFVTGGIGTAIPGRVYVIDPRQAPGPVTVFEDDAGFEPIGLTFTGTHIWTANLNGSITSITIIGGVKITHTAGFTRPSDILWDGENLWVADSGDDRVKRVGSNGAVLEFIQLRNAPADLLFDGANLWVSNAFVDSVTVIRAMGSLRGTVLETITGNGLDGPEGMAFDGERVLVVNSVGNSVSLFKATDFTPLGNVAVGSGTNPRAACSDGLNFWITRTGPNDIVRF